MWVRIDPDHRKQPDRVGMVDALACEACRHWKRLTTEQEGRRDSPARDDFASWGQCRRQDDPDTPIYSQDSSDYWSWITTRADFWCSEFAR